MIRFLLKGLLRDRSRSLFPVITVIAGVVLTVLVYCWVRGTENDLIKANANFNTGHVKIMSRAYSQQADQIPNDLAFIGVNELKKDLETKYPAMFWTARIRFGGLLDIPDTSGQTRIQAPVTGLAVDLLSQNAPDRGLLRLEKSLVSGSYPRHPDEILISDELARRLGIHIGETATLITATMYGSMTTVNLIVCGTIRFGISAMDRGAVIAELKIIQQALDMEDAAGEILGFYTNQIYHQENAVEITRTFNRIYQQNPDEFSPMMVTLRDQSGLGQVLDMASSLSAVLIGIFVVVMSIVLWNAGLMGSIRRYGEIGVRLAIGEDKGHLYRSIVGESLLIGFFGSVIGTGIGLAMSYYLQIKGIDISAMLKNSSMVISDVLRAQVTPVSFLIGFIPGLLATFLGTSVAGIGIYKRQTAQLSKELEA